MTIHNEESAELRQALKDFAASPRFSFLKSLQVGPILGDDAKSLGAVAQMTFEELVTALDNHDSDLHQLNDAQERLLTAVLRALCEGEVAESSEPSFDAAEEPQDEGEGESSQTTFNSVQCELELRDRIGQMRGHPDLSRVKDATVGTYWAEGVPRAPFEESLTIGQLLSLDLGVLAKKRSMTSMRMKALALALENALRALEGEEARPQERDVQLTPPPVSFAPSERRRTAPRRHRWIGHFDSCAPGELALLESVIGACSDDPSDAETVHGALHHFCSVFSVSDFLSIMRGEPLSIPAQKKLAAWTHSASLRAVVPTLELMLQGPGVHISRIAGVFNASGMVSAAHGIVSTLIVRGLGGGLVAMNGATCPDVWTRNPKLVTLIVQEARRYPKTSLSRALTDTCPDMDPFLHSWLQGIASPQKKGNKRQKRR